jgi:mono/diheme cytochrome c family protein
MTRLCFPHSRAAISVLLLLAWPAPAAETSGPKFEKDVLPIFTEYCFTCHGQSSPRQGLDLRTASSTLRGSNNGPVIVKGSPEQSLLYQKVSAHAMPPPAYKQKVPDSAIETIKAWISAGAASDQPVGALSKEAAEQRERFQKEILPIFTERCVQCHGAGKPMASLDLRTLASLLNGSKSGPVLAEGKSDSSVLVRKVVSHAMPPPGAGRLLSADEVRVLREWIDRGHLFDGLETTSSIDRPFTDAEAPPITSEQRAFWSFRKPLAAAAPKVRGQARVRTPIDSFVLAKLEAQGFNYSADAPNLTLMRRAYFDLIGLPPTPDEIHQFMADVKPGAYERLIDRLLASPHYGERWCRHWLDAVGYVDTTGKDFDANKAELAEGMWRYRDYVIKSIDEDKPWDKFLQEQIAGDEMVDWQSEKHYSPETIEKLTATGYMRNVLDNTTEDITNLPTERYEALFKLVEKVSASTLGLTVGCARCHTHKFDPIPQRDYYRFLALFTSSYNRADWLKPQDRYLWAASKDDKAEIEHYNAEIDKSETGPKTQLAALRKPYEKRLLDEKLKMLPDAIREDARQALETPADKRDDVQKYLFKKFGKSLELSDDEVKHAMSSADKATAEKLEAQVNTWEGYRRKLDKLQALWDVGKAPTIRLLQRGSVESPGPRVTPGFPEVLSVSGKADATPPKETAGKTAGYRLAFAEWLTSRENPLTARVIVNRLWQQHFGTGIVATPDNFGKMGAPPVNQPLLDWLAVDFMEHGWSAKRLHRMIMLSTTYRQSSRQGTEAWAAKAKEVDPENRLLWRMNLRRLDAETMRDAVIATAGKLDESIGGPAIPLNMQPDGLEVVTDPAGQWRRSVYLTARRTYPLNFLSVFDYPIIDTSCTRRTPSATPLQSLTMMNDKFILDNAARTAERVQKMAGQDAPAARKIEDAYLLTFQRKPSTTEVEMGEEYLKEQQGIYLNANETPQDAGRHAFESLTQMLLSSNEFLYVD